MIDFSKSSQVFQHYLFIYVLIHLQLATLSSREYHGVNEKFYVFMPFEFGS